MKTSVMRKKEKRSPHRLNEDLNDEESGGEKSSPQYEDLCEEKKVLIVDMKTSMTMK
ncbi:hypothetical protein [Bacillus sp. RO1]|uniref:hypothetical protein n=1 Tax=Bacillus sp. RO1 TaxID=2722703 RepID=UPI00145719A5|nr:hypothetical protein [Bacillus sp. RO1]NLP51607.1 hypothetical protein [Bacillus sp. RO1]